ncbi:putative ada hat complex component 1 [Rosellinia necatrix]|uniref:Putative ada hat complex component 1 n=1 Tax=Rosellinia necatrix TaxID=77044 RepID=A0A1S7UR82_ROSNE|nr:putative ada hat complex component 1 [Rosellinia necatrix]
MLKFRFWNSEHRGSDRTIQADRPMLDFTKSAQPWITTDPASISPPSPPRFLKRRRQSNAAIASLGAAVPLAAKRPRTDDGSAPAEDVSQPQKKVAQAPVTRPVASVAVAPGALDIEVAKDAIEEQFSLEILLKHDELRLINQELAKCQVALEQLRRCHLIPYPVAVPTPEQMLNITNGSGLSLQPIPGDKLPQWAPPFGVTDGPYARHYAKWLIPDPRFDGIQPEPLHTDSWRMRPAVEGRSTRNNLADCNAAQGKGRPARGSAGQKLHALSSGYPPPKDKNGPCVLKRSDGQTVKLVCIDCHRENFSSTQGFINHCRIAHKRDFKSHEEAAVHCGHPIEAVDAPAKGVPIEEKPTGANAAPSGVAHPFTRANGMTDSEACFSVVRRIQQSLELYRQGKLPGVSTIPSVPDKSSGIHIPTESPSRFSPSTNSPHLSRLLQSRGFGGNLGALVDDAKTKTDFDQLSSPTDDESEDREMSTPTVGTMGRPISSQAATGMRVPARAAMAPVVTVARPSSSKGTFVRSAPYVTPIPTPTPPSATRPRPEAAIDEDMLDIAELSPNAAVSNNAPSLVSDDGEYDDSADSDSASEMGDSIGAESISDVDEIDIEDDHTGARSLRHHRSASPRTGTRMRLGKGDTKQVSFVGPIKEENTKQDHGRGIDIGSLH